MLSWRPFDVPLNHVTREHLEALVEREVPEGLHVEYKRDWTSKGTARAAAAFANTQGGGTLIFGIEADGLMPGAVVGVEDSGDLEERVVGTIRDSVAPTPAFTPRAVDVGDGRACIVVEIPEGLEPPYILLRTGQVLERSQTGSEPVPIHNRDALDRLYARGERGLEWAASQHRPVMFAVNERQRLVCWTIPAVDGGLGRNSMIFKESFFEALGPKLPVVFEGSFERERLRWSMDAHSVTVSQEHPDYPCSITVETTGIVGTTWYSNDRGFDVNDLEIFCDRVLSAHQAITRGLLGHEGRVAILLGGSGFDPTLRSPVEVAKLDSTPLLESIKRQIARGADGHVYEPENSGPDGMSR